MIGALGMTNEEERNRETSPRSNIISIEHEVISQQSAPWRQRAAAATATAAAMVAAAAMAAAAVRRRQQQQQLS
ncbi:hypothetical protein QN277_026290 [Acacia crassicarpa]|uniref:Uncharacterized protein n=1 Tax=Acacia crassicarpa TaxID=499986 RepID=A0AAE1MF72_9FABA|nr:hypothetical protein QN277_026290 [Acacia crassicarpa]